MQGEHDVWTAPGPKWVGSDRWLVACALLLAVIGLLCWCGLWRSYARIHCRSAISGNFFRYARGEPEPWPTIAERDCFGGPIEERGPDEVSSYMYFVAAGPDGVLDTRDDVVWSSW